MHRPVRLYTLGPEGTFSDKAARRLRDHLAALAGGDASGAEPATPAIEYTRTIPEAVARTESDADALGVIPIENSDTGTVLFAQDALVRHQVCVEWEINLRVRFSLLANAPPEQVTTLFTQPVANDQCSFYVAEHLPRVKVAFTNSNTESGRLFLEASAGPPCAAIVPHEFGAQHRDWLLAEDVQNYDENTTRFLVVRAAAGARADVVHDFTRFKTSILIEPVADYPGLLYDLLSIFKRHGLNLCRLESRPAKVRPWTYVFFLDFNNNVHSAEAVAELRNGERTVTVLGSFDKLE